MIQGDLFRKPAPVKEPAPAPPGGCACWVKGNGGACPECRKIYRMSPLDSFMLGCPHCEYHTYRISPRPAEECHGCRAPGPLQPITHAWRRSGFGWRPPASSTPITHSQED